MDEKMEVEYIWLKEKLAKVREECSNLDIPKVKLAKEIALGDAAKMEMDAQKEKDNNKKGQLLNTAKNLRRQADDLQKEIDKKETALELLKDEVKELQTKINEKIAEVMKDPEVKKQLEEALKVRRERAAKKIEPLVEEKDKKEKEKDELAKRKDRLGKIAEAIKKKPELKKELEKSIKNRKELKELEEELKTCKDDTRELAIRRRIAELKDKILPEQLNKLASEVKKEKLDITLADIDGIVENGCVFGKDGSLNLDATLEKYNKDMTNTIKTREREINILNKTIAPYKDILAKKKAPSERSEGSEEEQQDGEEREDEEENKDKDEDEKLKWWQFGKRFQAWKEKRAAKKAQKALPKSEEEQQDEKKETPSNKSRKHLMESLIVRDAYDQMAKSQGIETRTQVKRKENQGR